MATTIELTPKQQANRWGTVVKIIGTVLLGLLVAPIIFAIIGGMIGVFIAAGVAIVGWMVLPVLGMMAANLKIKLLKAEAARNPVETMENELKRQTNLLQKKREAIITFGSKVKTFQDKVEMLKTQYPAEAQKFTDALQQMVRLYSLRQSKYEEAKLGLAEFEQEIEKASILWDVGRAAEAASESAGMTDEDFYAKIKVKSSLNAIQEKLNLSFASLDVALLDNKETSALKQLPRSSISTLELPVSQKVEDSI